MSTLLPARLSLSDHGLREVPHDRRYFSHFKLVKDQSLVFPEVLFRSYEGLGTEHDPYLVDFAPNDPRNPMNFSKTKKWYVQSGTISESVRCLSVLAGG